VPSPAGEVREPRPRQARPRRLAEACARLGVPVPAGADPGLLVTGVTHDSRSVRAGDLYAALPGARAHGADFARQAAERGAVAVLTDPAGADRADVAGIPVLVVPGPRDRLGPLSAWVYGEPAAGLATIGITGTNGKTTTAYLVEAALRGAGRRTGLIGTIETRIGERRAPSARTTPEAPDLQALLAVMREEGVDSVVMEVSSHALTLGRVDGLVFDVAVFTNLSQDHLDFHADLEDYFAAKASLFTPRRSRAGVTNVDDPYGARLATTARVPMVTVSPSGDVAADWRVTQREVAGSGATTSFTLAHRDGRALRAFSPLAGDFNVANTALAVVAGLGVGADPVGLVRGLARGVQVPGRMERIWSTGGDEPLAVVDYAHTPAAIDQLLAAVRFGLSGRLVVVLGAGGERDPHKRPAMGAAAARHAALVVVTDDNPRGEDPVAIRAAVLAGARAEAARSGARVVEVPDRGAAIRAAVRGTHRGDAVVLAGKGHETGQEIAGRVHPFDDRVALRRALEEWNDVRDAEVAR